MSGLDGKVDYGRLHDMYAKALDERNLYREKALEITCKVFNEYGDCPGVCSWCHLGDKTLNKCDKVIDDVDGCIND